VVWKASEGNRRKFCSLKIGLCEARIGRKASWELEYHGYLNTLKEDNSLDMAYEANHR